MTGQYTPTCPACRTSDTRTFYISCAGCQARKAHIEAERRQAQMPTTQPSGKT